MAQHTTVTLVAANSRHLGHLEVFLNLHSRARANKAVFSLLQGTNGAT